MYCFLSVPGEKDYLSSIDNEGLTYAGDSDSILFVESKSAALALLRFLNQEYDDHFVISTM